MMTMSRILYSPSIQHEEEFVFYYIAITQKKLYSENGAILKYIESCNSIANLESRT